MDAVGNLLNGLGKAMPHIEKARRAAEEKRKELEKVIVWDERDVPADAALVVFGSLGRDEWTSGSDLDWTLLIDGQANPNHYELIPKLQGDFKKLEWYKEPGKTETFGTITFSHDLVHYIGGDEDTNRNTTRRILLLLESAGIGVGEEVHDRVVRNVLSRYIRQEANHLEKSGVYKVPRFLLNDIVRYWRTIAVDFAMKERESGKKWGIRNAKLQVSRKLIFVSGLLMCIGCQTNLVVTDEETDRSGQENKLVQFLQKCVKSTPMTILSQALIDLKVDAALAGNLLKACDDFLALLDDAKKRKALEDEVTQENCRSHPVYREARDIGRQFEKALEQLFFEVEPLKSFTQHYGLF